MLNVISVRIGAFAPLQAAVAFIPLVCLMNCLVNPLSIVGLGVGMVSRHRSGTNLNIAVIIICVLRLMLGGGIF